MGRTRIKPNIFRKSHFHHLYLRIYFKFCYVFGERKNVMLVFWGKYVTAQTILMKACAIPLKSLINLLFSKMFIIWPQFEAIHDALGGFLLKWKGKEKQTYKGVLYKNIMPMALIGMKVGCRVYKIWTHWHETVSWFTLLRDGIPNLLSLFSLH